MKTCTFVSFCEFSCWFVLRTYRKICDQNKARSRFLIAFRFLIVSRFLIAFRFLIILSQYTGQRKRAFADTVNSQDLGQRLAFSNRFFQYRSKFIVLYVPIGGLPPMQSTMTPPTGCCAKTGGVLREGGGSFLISIIS